jgi:hypothetical protein
MCFVCSLIFGLDANTYREHSEHYQGVENFNNFITSQVCSPIYTSHTFSHIKKSNFMRVSIHQDHRCNSRRTCAFSLVSQAFACRYSASCDTYLFGTGRSDMPADIRPRIHVPPMVCTHVNNHALRPVFGQPRLRVYMCIYLTVIPR